MRSGSSRRWAGATYAAACVGFAAALGALTAQVQAGADPALGAGKATIPAPPRERLIITRRIVKTTVVTTRVVRRPKPVAVAATAMPSGGYSAPAGAATSYVAPAPAASAAPVAASPAPAAPAPAPAPAAPVTRGS